MGPNEGVSVLVILPADRSKWGIPLQHLAARSGGGLNGSVHHLGPTVALPATATSFQPTQQGKPTQMSPDRAADPTGTEFPCFQLTRLDERRREMERTCIEEGLGGHHE